MFSSFFGSQEGAMRQDLGQFGQAAERNAARTVAGSANRGAANPAALAMGIANAQAQQRAAMAGQQAGMLNQARAADQARAGQMIGGLFNAASSAGAMLSDERAKTNVQPAGADMDQLMRSMQAQPTQLPPGTGQIDPRALDEFMRATQPQQFQYAQGTPEAGQQRAGVMAQDLAQTPVGQTMLTQDPQTGMAAVDQNAALSALLAATSRLNQRIDGLEGMAPGTAGQVMSQVQPQPAPTQRMPMGMGMALGNPGRR